MLMHMTALALRYDSDTRAGRFRPARGGGSGSVRDARRAHRTIPMDESRKLKLQALQEQVQRGEYEIDPRKVADAIVARLMLESAPPRG
jgi:anti-sigma28 factor (negative regulator of flagellin synthesis)